MDRLERVVAAQLLLILWRAWFVRNELTHNGRWQPMARSVSFLTSYWDTLANICLGNAEDIKEKSPVIGTTVPGRERAPSKQPWIPPRSGWVKINTDGAFSEALGEAGIGVIIRNHRGRVILSGWKYLSKAGLTEEVEALAAREGLALAADWPRTQRSSNRIAPR
jgi:hypothetical protein